MDEHDDALARYMAMSYEEIVLPDVTTDGRPWYFAKNPELPGCVSDGTSPREALSNLREARALYISSLIEDGLPVPLPGGSNQSEMSQGAFTGAMQGPRRVLWEVLRPSPTPKHTPRSKPTPLRGTGVRGSIQTLPPAA